MRLLDGLLLEQIASAQCDLLFALNKIGCRHTAEMLFGKLRSLGKREISRKRNDDIRGAIALLFIAEQILPPKPFYVLFGTEYISAVVFRAERGARQKVEAQILGRILVHVDLLDDDALFPRELLLWKGAV